MIPKSTIILNLFLAVGLIGVYVLHFSKPKSKIAYVDSAKLLNGYTSMADARNEYEKKAKEWQSNIDTLTISLQGQIKKYEEDYQKMSDKERKLYKNQIRNKQNQLAN